MNQSLFGDSLEPSSLCWDCKQTKPLTEFPIKKKNGKPYSYCRECANRHCRERHHRRKLTVNNQPVEEKKCPDCGHIKPGSEFYSRPINKDGLSYCCKPCEGQRSRKAREHKRGEPPIPVPDGQKRCHKCGLIKPTSDFHRNRQRLDHVDVYCKECKKPIQYARYLKRTYGISPETYEAALQAQNGVCAICGQPETVIQFGKTPRLSQDHCHVTGKNRGLLCYKCNHLVGFIERSGVEGIQKATAYLQTYNAS